MRMTKVTLQGGNQELVYDDGKFGFFHSDAATRQARCIFGAHLSIMELVHGLASMLTHAALATAGSSDDEHEVDPHLVLREIVRIASQMIAESVAASLTESINVPTAKTEQKQKENAN